MTKQVRAAQRSKRSQPRAIEDAAELEELQDVPNAQELRERLIAEIDQALLEGGFGLIERDAFVRKSYDAEKIPSEERFTQNYRRDAVRMLIVSSAIDAVRKSNR